MQTYAVARRTKIINVLKDTDIDTSGYNPQYANFGGPSEERFLTSLTQLMETTHPGETE